MLTLGQKIKKLRGKATQRTFADALGININSLRHYEKDETTPNAEVIASICRETGSDPGWLLGISSEIVLDGNQECARCRVLEAELRAERTERRELSSELRAVMAENRELWGEKTRLRELLHEAGKSDKPDQADNAGRHCA